MIQTISSLPFGNAKAIEHKDPQCLGEQICKAFPGLNAYESTDKWSGCFAKTMSLNFASLKLVASAISPSLVDRDGYQSLTLMLPLAGQCKIALEGKSLQWGAGHSGVLVPELNGRLLGEGDFRTIVMLSLDPAVLETTARAMQGNENREKFPLRLQEPRLIPLQQAGRSLPQIISQLGNLIDSFACDVDVLQMMGYEEMLYRFVAGALCPELLSAGNPVATFNPHGKRRLIDQLCEWMLSDMSHAFTLAELAQKSGYSPRTLQYYFHNRYGCGPLDWLREQRLLTSQARLLSQDHVSIARLAYELGFGSASHFSNAYKLRFGELPSKTFKKVRSTASQSSMK